MNGSPPALPASGKKLKNRPLALTRVPTGIVPSTIQANCAPFEAEIYSEGYHELYILPEAYTELAEYVKFGKKRACNAYEQQYLGLGHSFIDEDNRIQTVISRILPICSANRGSDQAQVISLDNDAALNILKNERSLQNRLEADYNTDENGYVIDPFLHHGPSVVELFGHTHPGLSCFFSSVDHCSNYSTPTHPIVTFVCDPHQKDMKAMVGIEGEAMKVIACRPKNADAAPSGLRVSRDCSTETLWQRVSTIANTLLQQANINGTFTCRHDRLGRVHMQVHIIRNSSRRQTKE